MSRPGRVFWLMGLAWLAWAGAAHGDDWSLTRPRASRLGGSGQSAPADPRGALQRAEGVFRTKPFDAALLDRLVRAAERVPGGLLGLAASWEQALRDKPGDMLLAEGATRLLLRAGQPKRALEASRALLRQCEARLLLLAAEIAKGLGSNTEALAEQRRALGCATSSGQLREVRAALLATLIEQGALAEAHDVHRKLVAGSRELGKLRGWPDALAERGLHQDAAAALLELAAGTKLHKVELLRDAALQLLAGGDAAGAQTVLQRALPLATAGQRAELSALEEQCFREAGKLVVLAGRLDGSPQPQDRRRAARLWDELGDDRNSEAAWRAWLKTSPGDVQALRSLASLLQRAGRLDEAESMLRQLTQRAPHDPEAVESYVELLRSVGRDAEAVALLERAATSSSSELQLRASDLFGRLGQADQRRTLLQRLIRAEPGNADHVVALGELELAEGDREAALRAWRTLLARAPSRAAGLTLLAEILGDHGLVDEALATLEQALALAPDQLALRRRQASLLERSGQGPAAESAWHWVLKQSSADEEAQREARAHLVSLWKRLGVIPMRARMLAERVRASPADLEARRLLAELFARDPQRAESELELIDRIASSSEADPEVLRALAALHIRRDDVGRALGLLEQLAELVPEGAVDNLGRAVDLSLAHYRDDEALRYASRAIAVRPDDPAAHQLAAHVFRRRHELAKAMEAYRRVVELRPTAFDTRLQLAELAQTTGELQVACDQWLTVLGQAADDEQVLVAARRLMELSGELLAGRFERTLLVTLQARPARPLLRRLLIEWYTRGHTEALAVRPLLDTLDDPDATLRASAVALLAGARAPGTALPLLSRVERMLSRHEAAAALIAVGRIGDPAAIAPLRQLLGSIDARLRPIALWALLALSPQRAVEDPRGLLGEGDASVRSMAALALGLGGGADGASTAREQLREERHPAVRAALLWALARRPEPRDAGLFLAELAAPEPASSAALFGLRQDRALLARALFADDLTLRRGAARWWQVGELAGSLPAPTWPFDVRAYLAQVLEQSAVPAHGSLTRADGVLVGEAVSELVRDPARVERGLGRFVADGALLAPRELLEHGWCGSSELAAGFWEAAAASVERLAVDPRAPGHGASLVLLARGGRASHPAVAAALASSGDPVERDRVLAALADLGTLPAGLREALSLLFASADDWPTRLKVAPLLGGDVGKRRQASEPVALVRIALVTPRKARSQLVCSVPASLN